MPTNVADQANVGVRLALVSRHFPLHPDLICLGAYLREQHRAQVIVFVLEGPAPCAIGKMQVINISDVTDAINNYSIAAVLVDVGCDREVECEAREVVPTFRYVSGIVRMLDKLRERGIAL